MLKFIHSKKKKIIPLTQVSNHVIHFTLWIFIQFGFQFTVHENSALQVTI